MIIIIIIKKGWQCKAGRERLTPYQSDDPSGQPHNTNPLNERREKENSRRQKVSEQLGQLLKPASPTP